MASSVFVVVAYAIVLTFVAVRARAAREFVDFSLARRALPLALVFGSLCATYVGPGFSIGFVGKGFKSGFLFWGIGLAYSLQNILVGLLIAPRLRNLKDCCTLGDAIGQMYDRKCQILAGIISVSICTFLAAVMAHASGVVLNDIFGLDRFWSAVIVVGLTALYTTFGGLRASVITDAFQFTAFALLLPVTLLLALSFHLDGGGAHFISEASAATTQGFNSTSTVKIVGLLAAFFLGETLIPPYANRALASRTTGVSRNSFILAGAFSIVWFMVMISLGVVARNIVPKTTEEDKVLLKLVESIMPSEGYMLLLVVLVSIVMSSLDSLLNAGAVALTEDVVKPFVKLGNGGALNVGRWATIAIAAVAVACSPAVPSIISGLLICYTIWASAILPALIIGLWSKHPRPLAGTLSMIAGTLVAVVAIICLFFFPSVIEDRIEVIIIPGLGAAVLAYALGYRLQRTKPGG
ncbi:MAG TPA: sodium:solute symporter family protein [Sedimentisphaerales bacterium]|nr:sodium:solute symporter family protein [Sedimentisphaerales bacterium]